MARLVVLQGLQGSGKSSLAKKMEEFGWVRVNKDSIRDELSKDGKWEWSPKNEGDVIEIRNTKIEVALLSGKNVVSDDTNFGKHPETLKKIAARCNAEFQLKFIHMSLDECIRRDSLREGKAKVGEKVIRDMAAKFLPPPKRCNDRNLPLTVIVDLDGTIALNNGHVVVGSIVCNIQ